MPLKKIYKKLGNIHPDIREAKILAVVRSPYQQILSRINHNINFKGYKTSGETMQASQADLNNELGKYISGLQRRKLENYRSKNFQIYDSSFDESIKIKFLRFEDLKNELSHSLKSLGAKGDIELPFTKKGLQSSTDLFQEIASNDQIKIINEYHKNDFIRFGYEMILPS